jgi:hypothetical protein
MLFYRLDREIVDLPSMTDAFNEPGKLAKRDSSPITTVSDHRFKGAAMWGVWAEGNLKQGSFCRSAGRESSPSLSFVSWLRPLPSDWCMSLLTSFVSWRRFPSHLPCLRSPHCAGPTEAEGLREACEVWRCSSLIGVAVCLRWTSDCAWLKDKEKTLFETYFVSHIFF